MIIFWPLTLFLFYSIYVTSLSMSFSNSFTQVTTAVKIFFIRKQISVF